MQTDTLISTLLSAAAFLKEPVRAIASQTLRDVYGPYPRGLPVTRYGPLPTGSACYPLRATRASHAWREHQRPGAPVR